MKKFNSKILICLTLGMVFTNYSYRFVHAETTQTATLEVGSNEKNQVGFKSKLRRVGTPKASIIKYFELPNDAVTADEIYNASGIKSTNGKESTEFLNTGCFKKDDGSYETKAFQLKVESKKENKEDAPTPELKMVESQADNIDEDHFKVTSCKTEVTKEGDKNFLKITWQIEGYDLDSCTEIMLPAFWANTNNDSGNTE